MSDVAASRVATVVLVGAMLVLLFRHQLLAGSPGLLVVQALAVLLMAWARLTFGWRSFHAAATPTEGGLVTTGPYRFVRHPIYAAILLFVWVGAASQASGDAALPVLVATAAIAVRIASEEKLVLARYPEYAAYAARTRRVIPYIL